MPNPSPRSELPQFLIEQCGRALPDMSNPFIIHCHPVFPNEPKHDTMHGGACWCEPERQEEGNKVVWVHRRVN